MRTTREAAVVKPKELLKWAIIAFIAFYLIKQPTSAAHDISNAGNFLSSAARSVSNFVTSL
jgi:hypothetical protein